MTDLPEWIADPALAPAWQRIRERFEKSGLVAEGRVRVPLATRQERRAVGDLLGRTLTRESVAIDLATLDQRLRERSGIGGLDHVLTAIGGPLRDRPALRAAAADARERPLVLAAELVDEPWGADWVAGMRSTGLLTGRADAESVVRASAAVLIELTRSRPGTSGQSRVELAARVLGDAHALDRDRLVHAVVLRGLAAATGVEVPDSASTRESLWSRFGVEADLLSRTCLVWRLRADDSPASQRLGLAADAGDPLHLTAWDLRRVGRLKGGRVLVCENPRVLEAMAQSDVPGWSAVCTSGEPNLVVDRVVAALAAGGADLRYHGDFDWPGIAMANRALDRYAAVPWRMTAADYLAAVRSDAPPLGGHLVEPKWDAELGAAMRHHQRAAHEESVLPALLDSLT